MEVRNTPPSSRIVSRDSGSLLEDLYIALRNVAVWDSDLPSGRDVNYEARITELSGETGWRIATLLEDCLRFPATTPFVRGGGRAETIPLSIVRESRIPTRNRDFPV